MNRTLNARIVAALIPVSIGVLAIPSLAAGPGYDGFGPWTGAGAYLALMVLPGLALYLWIEREPRLVEALGCALAASPVIVAAVSVPVMLSGAGSLDAARVLAAAAPLAVALALLRARVPRPALDRRSLLVLAAVVVAVVALTAYLPLTDSWWRVRSDAWAHRAYIAEVADFGVPPMDPYFVGFPLQYMWAYHVLVNTVSDAVNVDPFYGMALVNVHALAGFMLCTFLFAGALTASFARRLMSTITATLGMNAAFWVFLPAKALKAFTGDTRGWAELARQYTITPFYFHDATTFMQIFHNKAFFLDKFMVGTAFGLGLCLMAAAWWAATRYLETRRPLPLVMAFVSTLGLLAFHTLVGAAMLAAVLGALAILFVGARGLDGWSRRHAVALAASMLLALAVAAPYVYSIVHSKDTVGQTSPTLFLLRIIGVAITVAFVAVLALFQRGFVRDRTVAARFVTIAAVVATVYALVVPLPGPNSYDKPPFFVFFPLAVVGAWTLVDLYRRRRAIAVAIALLAFVPVNALAFAAAFNTPPEWTISADEHAMAGWLRAHTDRAAVMLDDDDHVDFVVLGPRRHLWGRMSFAYQWGYDRLEMSRRFHTWRTVYSRRAMDATTLATLGEVDVGLYALVRGDRHAGVNATMLGEYFRPVHTAGSLTLVEVDTARCRADARSGRFPTVSEEELLRESGLQ